MFTLRFWDTWLKSYRTLFYVFALLGVTSMVLFWIAYLLHPAPLLQWEHFQQIETESVPIRQITVGLFDFSLYADNTLVFENLLGSVLQPRDWAYYIFLIAVVLVSIFFISIITTLSRYWFLMGTGLFILVLASFRLETLQLLGDDGKLAPGIIIFLYIILAFYFQSFHKSATLPLRVFCFAALTLVLILAIGLVSPIAFPFLQLAASAISVGLILTVLFMIMVAHEIVASFTWIVGQRKNNTKTFRQFMILSVAYLINLAITYLQKTGYLDWGVYTLNLYLLLSISATLSIWGFRQRKEQYNKIFPSDPFGVYIISGLFIICFATLGFIFFSGNDPAIRLIENMILYSHLGFGLIFILYIISNFSPMLVKNMAVFRVLYKPNTMPYFTFRIMGLIATYVFLAYDTNWRSIIDHGFSAYYNGRGDVYYLQGDETSAIGYFKRANFYKQTNHHGHYALATIYAAQVDPYNEREEYASAIDYAPTPFSYINLSDTYDRARDFESSARALKLGIQKFPNDGPLANALGLAYSRLQKADSALYYFQLAKDNGLVDEGSTNLIAQSNRIKSGFPADSLYQLLGSDAEGTKSNALALANSQMTSISMSIDEALVDTTLTAYSASLLSNYLINQRQQVDTVIIGKAVQLAYRIVNGNFTESILFAAAHAYYTRGEVNKAFRLMRQLAFLSGSGKYYQVLGLWSMEQRNALMASDYFEKAQDRNWPNAEFSRAVALTEADSITKALSAWQSIAERGDSLNVAIANGMVKLLSASVKEAESFSDADKYRYCRYKIDRFDTRSFEIIVNAMQGEEWKARAIYDMAWEWFEQDEAEIAADLLSQADGLIVEDQKLKEEIHYLKLLLAAASNNWSALEEGLKSLPFDGMHEHEKVYYEGLLAQRTNSPEAKTKFEYLMNANVQFDEGLAAATRYFASFKQNDSRHHQILIDGMLIKPNSIKLLKAYAIESARIGLEEEAVQALDKLRARLSFEAFRKFIQQNPDVFDAQ